MSGGMWKVISSCIIKIMIFKPGRACWFLDITFMQVYGVP